MTKQVLCKCKTEVINVFYYIEEAMLVLAISTVSSYKKYKITYHSANRASTTLYRFSGATTP